MNNFLIWRIQILVLKFAFHFKMLPSKFGRISSHFSFLTWSSFSSWTTDFTFYLLDIFAVNGILEFIYNALKLNLRPLTVGEISIAEPIFGSSINYKKIMVDDKAFLGPKQKRFCYVFCNTINSWGEMTDDIFIHEMVHIWQYQNLGFVYIPRALRAQKSKNKYNYGGVKSLKKAIKKGKNFQDFNYEQQGDIVADYFRIKLGYTPFWGHGKIIDLVYYEPFIDYIKTIKNK